MGLILAFLSDWHMYLGRTFGQKVDLAYVLGENFR